MNKENFKKFFSSKKLLNIMPVIYLICVIGQIILYTSGGWAKDVFNSYIQNSLVCLAMFSLAITCYRNNKNSALSLSAALLSLSLFETISWKSQYFQNLHKPIDLYGSFCGQFYSFNELFLLLCFLTLFINHFSLIASKRNTPWRIYLNQILTLVIMIFSIANCIISFRTLDGTYHTLSNNIANTLFHISYICELNMIIHVEIYLKNYEHKNFT